MSVWEQWMEEEWRHVSLMKLWWPAIRPKTLLASVGPVILGLALAYRHTHLHPLPTETTIDLDASLIATGTVPEMCWWAATLTLICAVLLQIGTNLVNDYYDGIRGIDGPKRLGPKRLTSSRMVSADKVRHAFTLAFSTAFALGLFLIWRGGLPIALVGISSILFAYLYTGGPFPLSYYALGEVLALVFFGPVAVAGTYYLQTLDTGPTFTGVLVAGMGPGLISAAIMAINNLRDRESDTTTSRKITLAILLGERCARALCLGLAWLPVLIPWMLPSLFPGEVHQGLFIVTLLPFAFWKTWRQIAEGPIDASLNEALARTGQYLFFYCVSLSLFLCLLP